MSLNAQWFTTPRGDGIKCLATRRGAKVWCMWRILNGAFILQGLLLASLNLAARCSQEPKLARLSASCIEHACEGAVTASIDIPQSVISGLVQAVQAQSSDAEVGLLHTHVAVLPRPQDRHHCDLSKLEST